MIKVLVADDHTIVRKGIALIIAGTTDIVVTDEAKNGQEVLEKTLANDFDIVLLDISMPGRNGLEILKELKIRQPKLAVLMLSMYTAEQYAIRALRSGAAGYLTKDSAPDELITAIRMVSAGNKYVSSSLVEGLAAKLDSSVDRPFHKRPRLLAPPGLFIDSADQRVCYLLDRLDAYMLHCLMNRQFRVML